MLEKKFRWPFSYCSGGFENDFWAIGIADPQLRDMKRKISSWWFQPSWKMCSSNWIISPGRDENKKYSKPPPRYDWFHQGFIEKFMKITLSSNRRPTKIFLYFIKGSDVYFMSWGYPRPTNSGKWRFIGGPSKKWTDYYFTVSAWGIPPIYVTSNRKRIWKKNQQL